MSHSEILTSLWSPDCDHLVGLMQLAETLSEHFDVVGGVWFQHGQFIAGLVAVSVHSGPLLGTHEPGDKKHNIMTEGHRGKIREPRPEAFLFMQNYILGRVEWLMLILS